MKWTIKLVFEVVPGSLLEHEVGTIERREEISPATVGLTIAEGKALLASLQKQIVVGFDGGGYVRNRHQRPERNFEIVAGKEMDRDGHATRFAFVRSGGPEAVSAVGLALRRCGVNESTSVTVLTDGDAGCGRSTSRLRHIMDWFHIAMRFSNLQQLAKGINSAADGAKRSHALAEIDRAKWRLWKWPHRAGNHRLGAFWAMGIPPVAQRLPAGRGPNRLGSLSMITPQLCTLSTLRYSTLDRAPLDEQSSVEHDRVVHSISRDVAAAPQLQLPSSRSNGQ